MVVQDGEKSHGTIRKTSPTKPIPVLLWFLHLKCKPTAGLIWNSFGKKLKVTTNISTYIYMYLSIYQVFFSRFLGVIWCSFGKELIVTTNILPEQTTGLVNQIWSHDTLVFHDSPIEICRFCRVYSDGRALSTLIQNACTWLVSNQYEAFEAILWTEASSHSRTNRRLRKITFLRPKIVLLRSPFIPNKICDPRNTLFLNLCCRPDCVASSSIKRTVFSIGRSCSLSDPPDTSAQRSWQGCFVSNTPCMEYFPTFTINLGHSCR